MATGAGKVSMREQNNFKQGRSGARVKRLAGPTRGGQKNTGKLSGAFRGGRGG